MGFKTSSYLTETLLDPELGHAYESNKAAFNKALNVEEDPWGWLERPENRLCLTRFGAAMDGLKNATPANAILEGLFTPCDLYTAISPLKYQHSAGYSWGNLSEGSLVVDVGGGVGSQSLTLASHYPQLQFVVQDREFVVSDAIDVCAITESVPLKI